MCNYKIKPTNQTLNHCSYQELKGEKIIIINLSTIGAKWAYFSCSTMAEEAERSPPAALIWGEWGAEGEGEYAIYLPDDMFSPAGDVHFRSTDQSLYISSLSEESSSRSYGYSCRYYYGVGGWKQWRENPLKKQ